MHKTTVYLPDDLKEALRRTAAAERRSEAEIIRGALVMMTREHAVPRPKLPLFASGEPDLAEQVDEALEGFGSK